MNDVRSGLPGRPGWKALGSLFSAFFVLAAGWSLTTAPGGAPDEIQHAFRAISVWDGQILAEPLETGGAAVTIPQSWLQIAGNVQCFTGHGEIAADCADWPADAGAGTTAGNSAGRYNPTYYLLVGAPFRLFAPETALHIARLLSCLLTAALLTLAAGTLLVRGGSVMARAGLVAALTPIALFLGGTINPSGLEIAGAIAGWFGLMYLARAPDHPAVRYFALTAGVGLSAMVVSRPASFLWLAVFGVVFLIAAGRRSLAILVRRRAVLVAAGSVAVVTAGCLLWNRIAHTSDVGTGTTPFGGRAEGFLQDLPEFRGLVAATGRRPRLARHAATDRSAVGHAAHRRGAGRSCAGRCAAAGSSRAARGDSRSRTGADHRPNCAVPADGSDLAGQVRDAVDRRRGDRGRHRAGRSGDFRARRSPRGCSPCAWRSGRWRASRWASTTCSGTRRVAARAPATNCCGRQRPGSRPAVQRWPSR